MSEIPSAELDALSPPRGTRGAAVPLFLAIAAATCLLGLIAALRPLSPHEARVLLDVLDAPPAPGARLDAAREIQRGWSYVAGTMVRPARTAAFLAAMTTLFAAGFLARRRPNGRLSWVPVAVLAAAPAFWREGTAIGGAAPLGVLSIAPAPLFLFLGAGRRTVAYAALTAIFAAAFLLPSAGIGAVEDPGVFAFDRAVRAVAGILVDPETSAPGTLRFAALAAAVLSVTAVGLGRGRRGAIDAALVLAAFAATGVFRIGPFAAAADYRPAFAFLLPIAALADTEPEGKGVARTAPIALAVLALIVPAYFVRRAWADRAAAVVLEARTTPEPTVGTVLTNPYAAGDRRAALDWIMRSVAPPAWLVLSGGERMIDRYYERVGHRTGLVSLMIPEEIEGPAFVSRAVLTKPPILVLIDPDPVIVAGLAKRYEPLRTASTVPEGVLILRVRP